VFRSKSAHSHIPELDGIRAVAILLVLCDHLLGGWRMPESVASAIPRSLKFVAGHGWLGVDLFFVLSGFLITGILLDSKENAGYFQTFYARRVLRIFPLYFAVIAVMWLGYPHAGKYFALSLMFLANFSYAFAVPEPHGPGVFWSLAIEEQFYLLWPMLIRFLSRRAVTLIALLVVIVTPLLRQWGIWAGLDPVRQIYSYSWFRFDGLALGALLAIWVRSQSNNRKSSLKLSVALAGISLVMTVAGIPLGILSSHNAFRYTQAQLVFAGFLLAAVTLTQTQITAPLRWGPMRLVGDISYCLYLTHLAIGDLCNYLVTRTSMSIIFMTHPLTAVIVQSLAMLGLSFAVALLSRRYFEKPILRLKRHFEYVPKEQRTAVDLPTRAVQASVPKPDATS
jgi:peptidoglycan/LPS O-acetylase OafA/YrhL